MLYIDEQIVYTLSISPAYIPSTSGLHKYTVKYTNGAAIFYGTVFISAGQNQVSIDITDIMRSMKYKDEILSSKPKNVSKVVENLIENITVQLEVSTSTGGTYTASKADTVCFVYRYPHILTSLRPNITESSSYTKLFPMLQCTKEINIPAPRPGTSYIKGWECKLTPRYPFIKTTEFGLGVVLQTNDSDEINFLFIGAGTGDAFTSEVSSEKINIIYLPLSAALLNASITKDNQNLLLTSGILQPIATFDLCPSRYYLQWIDRYGSYQCQPFEKMSTFKNEYSVTNMVDYSGTKAPIFNQVTSSFNINSGFVSDDILPIYESIFVSPKLVLYDTENDVSYDVVVKDKSFTEKTFKNQRHKMFNIQLNLEVAKQQNIIL